MAFSSRIKVAHQERDRLIRYCEQASLKTLVVPEMEELRGGEAKRSVRESRIEDLLGREEIHINLDEIGNLLEGEDRACHGSRRPVLVARSVASWLISRLSWFASTPLRPRCIISVWNWKKYKELNFVGDRRCPQSGPCGLCVPQLAPQVGVPCGSI